MTFITEVEDILNSTPDEFEDELRKEAEMIEIMENKLGDE